jgi:hypothetical protein
MEDFGFLKIGNIQEVKHYGYQPVNTYTCLVDIEWPTGEIESGISYSTNSEATIQPGKWVYDQIIAGNFSGEITEMESPTPPTPPETDEDLVEGL